MFACYFSMHISPTVFFPVLMRWNCIVCKNGWYFNPSWIGFVNLHYMAVRQQTRHMHTNTHKLRTEATTHTRRQDIVQFQMDFRFATIWLGIIRFMTSHMGVGRFPCCSLANLNIFHMAKLFHPANEHTEAASKYSDYLFAFLVWTISFENNFSVSIFFRCLVKVYTFSW